MRVNCKVVILLLTAGVAICEGKFAVVCRIGDPQVVKECDVLRQCLYEVHPVETAQSVSFGGGLLNSLGSQNKLFALYGGPSSCGYFGNLINSCKGRQTLVETVKKQLQKSGYRGVDLQCDPGLSQINQQDYADFLTLLREEIGSGYVISVVIQSINIEPCVVNVLSEVVDLVTIPLEGCALQASIVQNLIGHGLSRQKILLDVTLPAVLSCPLDSGVNNLYSLVQNAVNIIDNQQLLGATLQLDRDDTAGVCAKGRFPLFKLLLALLKNSSCNFKGYVRDTRDCSSFYSCNHGVPNHFQCPAGLAFDLCSNTCQPVVQVNCDQNSCTLTGAVNGGCNQVPIPIPYPFLNPGSCDNNNNCTSGGGGSGDSDICLNITSLLVVNNQTSALLELLANTQLEGTLALVNDLTRDLQLALGGIVGEVNNLLARLLLHDDAIGNTLGQMDQMQRQMGLLEKLLKAVLELLDNLLGLNLLGGGAGGGALAGASGATGLVAGLTGGGGGSPVASAAAVAGAAAAAGGAADAGAITNAGGGAAAGGLLSGLGRR
ncbi:AAEL006328-PA [Aedes aegypti]|uniref:AAEL006328-PA n=1 Tax=Aedes aegypti TaxID=7159 RepID=Q176I1_AEDAE|nr:AAEL006328-PA [Aedes aegypti]